MRTSPPMRRALVHQSQRPVDLTGVAAACTASAATTFPGLGRRAGRSDDERPEIPACPDDPRRVLRTPARRSPSSRRRTSCARSSATGCAASAFPEGHNHDHRQRHRRRACIDRHAAAVRVQRGAVRVRVRGGREAPRARAPRRDVSVDDRLRSAQGGAGSAAATNFYAIRWTAISASSTREGDGRGHRRSRHEREDRRVRTART